MVQNKTVFDTLVVVKRSGQRTEFNGEKIALAIQKAFDSVDTPYKREEANRVYGKVLSHIEEDYRDRKTIKIEDIQDLIEKELKQLHFQDVYRAFTNYREQRATSRETFVIKQQHKFLKAIEKLGLGTEKDPSKTAVLEESSPSEVIYNFGITIAKEFAKAYLLENKYVRAHDSGLIHIHDIEFIPMGTTSSIQIELDKVLRNGFSLGCGPVHMSNDIFSYVSKAADSIEAVGSDQHGPSMIGSFDYYMATGALKTFKKILKKQICSFLTYQGLLDFINMDRIRREIDKLEHIELSTDVFEFAYKKSTPIKDMFDKAYEISIRETQEEVYCAMYYFVERMNAIYTKGNLRLSSTSIGLGTDVSKEGYMVTESILLVLQEMIEEGKQIVQPKVVFKGKEKINFDKKDPNYGLLELACQTALTVPLLSFCYLDASFNQKNIKENDFKTEVMYTSKGERVVEDRSSTDVQVTGGKGNLCTTSINIPRIGIKHGICLQERKFADVEGFYKELEEMMDLVKDQLLERFELQCSKHCYNFPFLIGQGVWNEGEKVKDSDRLRKVLKHGTLCINIVGLAETLKALLGKDHGESEGAMQLGEEIVSFMRSKVDGYSNLYNLNFTVSGTHLDTERERFMNIDKTIYGKMKGITDRSCYSHSFHLPDGYSLEKKIEKESPFHGLTSGGHTLCVKLGKEKKSLIEMVSFIKNDAVGFVSIEYEKKGL